MSQLLENEASQVPVTALETWDDLVLVGQGFSLRIFHRKTTELLCSERIFTQQAIHGFAKEPGSNDVALSLIILGGRSIRLCKVTREYRKNSFPNPAITVNLEEILNLDEWIFDVSFRPMNRLETEDRTSDSTDAVLVNAHNKIFRLKTSQDDKDSVPKSELELLFPGPRCILYSATLKWLCINQVLVASGTAFGEIIVWSLSLSSEKIQARKHFIFTGHEGSIFGVRISGPIQINKESQLRLLSSCSDDRTIRVWNITDLSQGTLLTQSSRDGDNTNTSRTTGFLNYVSEDAAAASKSLCIASAMGHLSRIWDVRYANDRSSDDEENYIVSIVSVGEDAACQTWRLTLHEGSSSFESFSLLHSNTANHHSGKNIWSSFLDSNSQFSSAILTGGADGKVVEHTSLFGQHSDSRRHVHSSEWDIEDVARLLSPNDKTGRVEEFASPDPFTKRRKPAADCFRSFVFVTDTQVLLTTNNGCVVLANMDQPKGSTWTWKLLTTYTDLGGYSVASRLTSDPFEYVFLGDSKGNIYYFHSFFEEVKVLTNIEGKITKIMPEVLPQRSHEYINMVVTRHGGLPPMQLRVTLGAGGTLILSSTKIFVNQDGDEIPVVTSCVIATHNKAELAVILGCRNGSIFSYLKPDSPRAYERHLSEVHGKEAVTSMLWMPYEDVPDKSENWDSPHGYLFSVGRDGTLAIHTFIRGYHEPTLVHRLNLSFGPNLEGLHIDPYTNDVSVWGFTSKYFICHNVSAMEDILRLECGGAHRTWTFLPSGDSLNASTGGSFAWLKQMKLNITRVKGPSHRVIQAGGHGREIRTCAIAPSPITEAIGPLIATGSEDTDISLFYYADWHGPCSELVRLSVLRKHVTGVQSLHWCEDGEFLFSCGGFEEFFVWRVRPIPGLTVGVVCESVCPLETPDSELRLMDFTVRKSWNPDNGELICLIAMVFSDSSIKVWNYTSNAKYYDTRQAWSFVASGQYTTACLTTIVHLGHRDGAIWPATTGSTDGHLAFWSLTETSRKLVCHAVQHVHQSSIKALEFLELAESWWLVVSGGDDNALGLTLVEMDNGTEKCHTSSMLVPNAHSASITALRFFPENQYSIGRAKVRLITASNDQRVKLWQLDIDMRKRGVKGIEITPEGNFPSAVADISSMSVIHGRSGASSRILICGVGMEVWRLQVPNRT